MHSGFVSPSRDDVGSGVAPLGWKRARRAVPALVWLNLICLDAPVVAVAWLYLFATTFRVPLSAGNAAALFLTAWLIYLIDRFADAVSLEEGPPRSLRQEFCLRHRKIWICALPIIGGFDAYVIWRSTAMATFLAGAVIGVLTLIYLVLNHPRGRVWRSLPAKETAIGFLFAAGTLVALLPNFPPVTFAFVACGLAFAGLCTLNCIAIACWERDLDQAQGKVSVATMHPRVLGYLGNGCVLLALAAFGLAWAFDSVAPIFVCVAASGLLLAALNASGRFNERRLPNRSVLDSDQRAALADLVLLMPLVLLLLNCL